MRRGESGADVRRHIIGSFDGVPVETIVFWYDAAEKRSEIVNDVRIGVLLDGQRGGCVLNEYREKAGANVLKVEPCGNFVCELVKPLAAGGNRKTVRELSHMRL